MEVARIGLVITAYASVKNSGLSIRIEIETGNQAIEQIGGLDYLAETRPWVFDFLRMTPLEGYDK